MDCPAGRKISAGIVVCGRDLSLQQQEQKQDPTACHLSIANYHIEKTVNGQPQRGFPSQTGWLDYQVVLLAGDLWHAHGVLKALKPGENVSPNTDLYQDGIIEPAGIRFFGFCVSNDVMPFSVEGLKKESVKEGVISLESMMGQKVEVSTLVVSPNSDQRVEPPENQVGHPSLPNQPPI